jgi:ABC-type branched-subunit amino acid transport system substrate-binding protein
MKTIAGLGLCCVAVIALACAATPVSAQSSTGGSLQSSDVGITPTTIRIAVVADVENPLDPGLFGSVPAALNGFAKYINAHGGLAGRKLVVDFIDSHLNADDARNAIIKACSQDFATVGTAALFLSNVSDATGCPDKTGAATGLPDLPIITTEVAQQCSPVSFPINPSQLLCSTANDNPQTYRANRGTVQYYERTGHKNLHGIFVYSNDLKSAAVGGLVLARGAQAAGVTSDGEDGVSATAPQSAFTPFIQQMKGHNSNYALDGGPVTLMVALRKEAALQGLSPNQVVWDCFSNCYDQALITQGGTAVEGQYVTLSQLPLTESGENAALANYLKSVPRSQINGYGSYAWAAGILFRDAVNAAVQKNGKNGLTRAALLTALSQNHAFNADGMFGTIDIGNRVPTPCFMILQVRNGKFTRVYPSKPGTLDCTKSNNIDIKENLLGP